MKAKLAASITIYVKLFRFIDYNCKICKCFISVTKPVELIASFLTVLYSAIFK